MELKLPTSIMSPDDLSLVTLEVTQVIDLSREQSLRKTKPKTKGAEAPTLAISPQLRQLLGLSSGDAIPGPAELTKVTEELAKLAGVAPVAHITLPGVPAEKFKAEVLDWLRQNIHSQMLAVFEFNRGLAGGFAIRLGSQIFDFSFRHRLLNNSGAMVKVMKHV